MSDWGQWRRKCSFTKSCICHILSSFVLNIVCIVIQPFHCSGLFYLIFGRFSWLLLLCLWDVCVWFCQRRTSNGTRLLWKHRRLSLFCNHANCVALAWNLFCRSRVRRRGVSVVIALCLWEITFVPFLVKCAGLSCGLQASMLSLLLVLWTVRP